MRVREDRTHLAIWIWPAFATKAGSSLVSYTERFEGMCIIYYVQRPLYLGLHSLQVALFTALVSELSKLLLQFSLF